MLFTIYSSKLFEVIKYHLPEAHAYADDAQLYLSFSPDAATNQTDAVVVMERCISDIRTWMLTDKLKLSDDKTEFMLIGTKQQLSKVNIDSLTAGGIDVASVTVARNLGTWFDSNLNLQEQIHKTCKREENLPFPSPPPPSFPESTSHQLSHGCISYLIYAPEKKKHKKKKKAIRRPSSLWHF